MKSDAVKGQMFTYEQTFPSVWSYDAQSTMCRVTFRSVLEKSRMNIPQRGLFCLHASLFDLQSDEQVLSPGSDSSELGMSPDPLCFSSFGFSLSCSFCLVLTAIRSSEIKIIIDIKLKNKLCAVIFHSEQTLKKLRVVTV